MDEAGQICGQLEPEEVFVPASSTTDGWRPVQNAWKTEVPEIDLIECKLHGKKRLSATLDDFTKTHQDWSPQQRQQVRDDLNSVLEAPSLSAFSQINVLF